MMKREKEREKRQERTRKRERHIQRNKGLDGGGKNRNEEAKG